MLLSKPKTIRFKHAHYRRLQIWLRPHDKNWLAYTYLDGEALTHSTGTDDVQAAFRIAESWYKREVRASQAQQKAHPIDLLCADPTVGELYASYHDDLKSHKKGYAKQKWGPIQTFWRAKTLSELDVHLFNSFISTRRAKNVCDHTIHKDITLIRQVLKYAMNHGRLERMPHIPPLDNIEKNPRPWFTKSEWRHLLAVSQIRILNARNRRNREQRQDVHDLLRFMLSSMVRVGEAYGLRYSACTIEKGANGRFLTIEMSGKKRLRRAVTTADAVAVYERRLATVKAAGGDETHNIFPINRHAAFRSLLEAAGLLTLVEAGKTFERNLKSVRCTSISFFLIDHPEVNLQIVADNAGTSPGMIDSFYAKRLSPLQHTDVLSLPPVQRYHKPLKSERDLRLAQLKDAHKKLEAEIEKYEKE